jgi:hypothetical protein
MPPPGQPIPPELAKRLAEMQPAEANAPVVEYLLSDLSRHVTGQIVRIDKQEVSLLTHPALLVPPAIREEWTAEALAEAFEREFKDRLIPTGIWGMQDLPVPLQSGYWKRMASGS